MYLSSYLFQVLSPFKQAELQEGKKKNARDLVPNHQTANSITHKSSPTSEDFFKERMKKITQQVKTGAADLRRIRKQSSQRPKLATESTAKKEEMEAFSHHLWKEGKTDEMKQ